MQVMNPENAFTVQPGKDLCEDHRGTQRKELCASHRNDRGKELCADRSSTHKVELCADHREQVTT